MIPFLAENILKKNPATNTTHNKPMKTKTLIAAAFVATSFYASAAVIFTEDWEGGPESEWTTDPTPFTLPTAGNVDPSIAAQLGSTSYTSYVGVNHAAVTSYTFADLNTFTLDFDNFKRSTGGQVGLGITAEIGYWDGTFNSLASVNFGAVGSPTTVLARTMDYKVNGGAEIGELVAIRFTSDSGSAANFQAGVDNIVLSVPEPSSTSLLGLGVLALALRRRR